MADKMLRVNIGLNRTLLWLVLLLAAGWLLVSLRSIIFELLIALGIAYVLDPLVDRLERLVRSRALAIVLMLIPLLGIGTLVGVWLIPRLISEIGTFVSGVPGLLEKLVIWAKDTLVHKFGVVPPRNLEELMTRFGADIRGAAPQVLNTVQKALGRIVGGSFGVFRALSGMFLVPIFALYLLYDFDRIVAYVHGLIPLRYEVVVVRHLKEIDRAVASFFRGQLVVCLILGTLYSIGYSLVGIDLALVIGLGTGLMAIVPYLGATLGFLSALTCALIWFSSWLQVLGVILVFTGVQALDATMITPRVLGRSVNLSPVFVLIALMVGGSLLGFVGVLIAVPVAASLRVIGHSLVAWYKQTGYYRRPAPEGPDEPHEGRLPADLRLSEPLEPAAAGPAGGKSASEPDCESPANQRPDAAAVEAAVPGDRTAHAGVQETADSEQPAAAAVLTVALERTSARTEPTG